MEQKGSENGSNMAPKTDRQMVKHMMFFLIDFRSVLEPPTVGRPPGTERAGAVEGVGGGINPSPLRFRRGLVDLFDD